MPTSSNPITLSATGPFQTLEGTPGNDALTSDFTYVTLVGGDGDDTFMGAGYLDRIDAGAGDDTVNLTSGIGYDAVDGGEGNNFLRVPGIRNSISAGNGFNTVVGTAGFATIAVGSGGSRIAAGGGGNTVTASGNGANAVTIGRPASDGGDGSVPGGYEGGNTVRLGSGRNDVVVTGANNRIMTGDGDDTVSGPSGLSALELGGGNNRVSVVGDYNTVTTGDGNDEIQASPGNFAWIRAGGGVNTVSLSGNYDTVQTGDGADTVSIDGYFNVVSTGGSADVVRAGGSGGYMTADLGDGDDQVDLAGPGGNWIRGGDGRDTVSYAISAGGVSVARVGPGTWTVRNGAGFTDTLSGVEVLRFTDRAVALSPAPESLVVLGAHGQYSVAQTAGGDPVVLDRVDGRDGIQQPAGLRDIQFADGVGRYDPTGNAEKVARLYQAAFSRPADLDGLNFNVDRLDAGVISLNDIAGAFASSTEFNAKYGALDDRGFVQLLYVNTLGRQGDGSGVDSWTGVLRGGASRAQVLASFSESRENKHNTMDTIGDRNTAEAYRLYQAAFNRTPDQAGLDHWTDVLDGGASPLSVAQAFVQSAEFQAAYGGAGLDNAGFVGKLYDNTLHRPADLDGQQFWTAQLNGGASRASMLLAFSDSTENRLGTAGATHDAWVFLG